MFIPHLLRQNLISLSCFYLKGCVLYNKISIRTFSCSGKRKRKVPFGKNKIYVENALKKKKPPDPPPKRYMRDTIAKISSILRFSTWDVAQVQLQCLAIEWDSYTVNQVLKTHPPMQKAWLFFNWAAKLEGFKHDQYTCTTMLDIFGEAGRISSMKLVFEKMKEKGIKIDVVTYTSMLHWLSNDGDFGGAASLWEEMRKKDCGLTVVSYTAYMKILFNQNREKEAADVYKEMLEAGLTPNCYTYTVLMVHLADSGKFKEVMEIFMKMQYAGAQPDKAACNILIGKCCKAGKTSEMTKILLYMKANSLVLRYPVYLKAIDAFRKAGESDILLREVNRHLCSESFSQGANVPEQKAPTKDEIIILGLLEKKCLVAVDHLLSNVADGSMQLDSRLISTIIEENVASERQSGAVLAFDYSVNHGISINSSAYLALIGMFVRKQLSVKVVEIVEKMIRQGLSLGTQMSTLLVYRLGCAREPIAAATVFSILPPNQKNTATYTALIGAYFASGDPEKALQTFETMKAQGINVALGTYCILLNGLEKSGRDKQLGAYRKEMRNLQAESLSEEEKICNLLFSGKLVTP